MVAVSLERLVSERAAGRFAAPVCGGNHHVARAGAQGSHADRVSGEKWSRVKSGAQWVACCSLPSRYRSIRGTMRLARRWGRG
jgi:hypothetical protein